MSRDSLLYLEDIAEAAEKIRRFVEGLSFAEFIADEVRFDAVLFNLQIIGEAAKQLPETIRQATPEFDWSKPARFRDMIAHHYFALDPHIVWDVIIKHLPHLRTVTRRLLSQWDDDPG